jgi:hypothetical protein
VDYHLRARPPAVAAVTLSLLLLSLASACHTRRINSNRLAGRPTSRFKGGPRRSRRPGRRRRATSGLCQPAGHGSCRRAAAAAFRDRRRPADLTNQSRAGVGARLSPATIGRLVKSSSSRRCSPSSSSSISAARSGAGSFSAFSATDCKCRRRCPSHQYTTRDTPVGV